MKGAKYAVMYFNYDTGHTDMAEFRWAIARMWFLVTKARRALVSGRVQLIDIA